MSAASDPRIEALAAGSDATLQTFADAIAAADQRIAAHIRRTPVLVLEHGAFGLDARLVLKLEHTQIAGSFKARGAFNRLLAPGAPAQAVAASGGNHGVAVATAAAALGRRAEIFTPTTSSATKQAAIQATGAALSLHGVEYAEAAAAAEARALELGVETIHAYDQWDVAAGQGTLGREFRDQADACGAPLDAILIAVGGGGLLAGVAGAVGAAGAAGAVVRIVAVEPERAPSLHSARRAGGPVDVQVGGIAADALGARRVGRMGFALAAARVAPTDAVLVDDAAIAAARRALWDVCRLSVEPAAAAGLAALLSNRWSPPAGATVGVLLCGANAGPALD